MTCIVGMEFDGGVMIGGDSIGSSNYHTIERKDSKVFKTSEFIIGYTTSFRMAQLLRFSLKCDKQKSSESDFKYMCTTFIDAVRICFKNGGFLGEKNNQEIGGTFLVGYKGKLYTIEDDLQVGITTSKMNACGCGLYYALGSMFTSRKLLKKLYNNKEYNKESTVKEILKNALLSATEYNGAVGGKLNFITQKLK